MRDTECPYCGEDVEINHDDGYGYGYGWSIAHLNPGNFPVSSHNLPSRSRTEVAAQPCG